MNRTFLRGFLIALVALLVSACASLPPPAEVERSASTAISDHAGTPLAGMLQPRLAVDGRSGFRLLPEAASSYMTRIELARQATRSLDVQYYLLAADNTGRYLMRTLRDAAARGVRVRLLVDDMYTAGEDDLLLGLAAYPNVEVRLFNPFPGARDSSVMRWVVSIAEFARVNRRMHNKLFVADNAAAVVGGRNIADEYFMRADGSNFIDLDTFAAGPVVRDMSAIFDRYWNSEHVFPVQAIARNALSVSERQAQFEALTVDATPPVVSEVGSPYPIALRLPAELARHELGPLTLAPARVFADSLTKTAGSNETNADGTVAREVVEWMMQARGRVLMVTPYFIPGEAGMKFLQRASSNARAAGLSNWLTVSTNSLASTDEPLVYSSYSNYRLGLLELGVQLYEFSPSHSTRRHLLGLNGRSQGALHMKMIIRNNEQLYLGSLNMDQRSLYLNTEMGIIIDSPALIAQILPTMDPSSAYQVRLKADGKSVEWVHHHDGTEEVFDVEPETTPWFRFKLRLMSPFVPERLL